MRLFMIGHFSKGKTTLLSSLKRSSIKANATQFDARIRRIGVDVEELSHAGLLML